LIEGGDETSTSATSSAQVISTTDSAATPASTTTDTAPATTTDASTPENSAICKDGSFILEGKKGEWIARSLDSIISVLDKKLASIFKLTGTDMFDGDLVWAKSPSSPQIYVASPEFVTDNGLKHLSCSLTKEGKFGCIGPGSDGLDYTDFAFCSSKGTGLRHHPDASDDPCEIVEFTSSCWDESSDKPEEPVTTTVDPDPKTTSKADEPTPAATTTSEEPKETSPSKPEEPKVTITTTTSDEAAPTTTEGPKDTPAPPKDEASTTKPADEPSTTTSDTSSCTAEPTSLFKVDSQKIPDGADLTKISNLVGQYLTKKDKTDGSSDLFLIPESDLTSVREPMSFLGFDWITSLKQVFASSSGKCGFFPESMIDNTLVQKISSKLDLNGLIDFTPVSGGNTLFYCENEDALILEFEDYPITSGKTSCSAIKLKAECVDGCCDKK
jgi:hypothetical protein